MDRVGLIEDPLFLACTRPAMWRGVPLMAVALNFAATGIVFVIMSNPLYLGIGVLVHFVTRAIVSRDYNMFQVLWLWTETKGRARNRNRWGGSSVSPLPLRPARRDREVRISA